MWLPEFKAGNEQAVSELWKRYFGRIVQAARHRLVALGIPRRVEDEVDVGVTVFRRLCILAEQGKLGEVHGSEDLWALLVTIIGGKVTDLRRRQIARKRGGGDVRGDSAFQKVGGSPDEDVPFEGYLAKELSPEAQVIVAEELNRLLGLLPDEITRAVAQRYLQGQGKTEIAKDLTVSRQVVYRKVDLILAIWKQETDDERS